MVYFQMLNALRWPSWDWWRTGIGPAVSDLRLRDDDLPAFHAHSRHESMRRVRWLVVILLTFNLVFWATDGWLLGHIDGAVVAMGEGRLAVSIAAVAILATSVVRGVWLVVWAWLASCVTCGIVAWTLGRIGPPSTAWFHYGYPFLFFPLLAWMRPLHRVLVTSVLCAVMGICYFGPHPVYLQDPMAGSTMGNLLYLAILGTLLGFSLDQLRLRLFILGRERERQIDSLAVQVAQQTEHITRLLDHVERARETERRELAIELHDEMGQVLTGMRLMVQVASERVDAAPSVQTDLNQLSLMLGHATRTLRAVLERLRPRILDELGLGAAAEWLLERTATLQSLARRPLKHSIEMPSEAALQAVSDEAATVAFRVIQEALTNMVKHANASQAHVYIQVVPAALRVHVQDDGLGFDPDQLGDGLGVLGMVERARAVGGVLLVESRPGAGTTVSLQIPMETA